MGGHVLAVHPMMAPASEIFLNAQVPGFRPSVDRLTTELRLSVLIERHGLCILAIACVGVKAYICIKR